jgi:hypothetical protein
VDLVVVHRHSPVDRLVLVEDDRLGRQKRTLYGVSV